MIAKELREKFLKFMESKGHTIIPSASLVPENDPSVLFTTAGMHPLVPYLLGEKHPGGKRVTNVQKCIRTGDIDEVGDTTHHTFFEMLGNWSFGDYFKKEAIEWSWEFLTSSEWLNLDKNRIAVSVFAGDVDAPFDEESYNIWKKLGMSEKIIAKLPKANNWWGMETGPCGPDSEMFYWVGDPKKAPESFNDDNVLWVEIWNDVFMEFNKLSDGKLEPLKKKNVDTGMGMERMLAAINGLDDNYKTELFWPVIQKIEELSGFKYGDKSDEQHLKDEGQCWIDARKSFRIIADHIKASVFMISDGVSPLNIGRGYVLRRLIRRAIRHGKIIGIENSAKGGSAASGNFTKQIAEVVIEIYKDFYKDLDVNRNKILEELEKEEDKFRETLEKGLKEFENAFATRPNEDGSFKTTEEAIAERINKIAFYLFQTYGFPLEMTIEEAKNRKLPIKEENLIANFNKDYEGHQEKSRTASAGMFKGGLADSSEETKKLHTAAHLLLAALRKVLGTDVLQKGSNITAERLRFDFSHPEKLKPEQIKETENLVNDAIAKNLPVVCNEMSLEEAKAQGAMGVFESKYGEKVKVYKIGDFSNEICGGPHVDNTGQLGRFKIAKEESSSAGVRRIKAVLE